MLVHLGVIEQNYADSGMSTGTVAEILEDHYGVMEKFVELHRADIVQWIGEAITGDLENQMMGAPASGDPLAGAMAKIEARFREYLDKEEILQAGAAKDPKYPVPTGAALEGKSSRFKSGMNKTGRRPSFIDTGIFYSSFRAWSDGTL